MISIIVPVFNAERYLEACVAAVQAQTVSDWELLLVDDGSTDGSYAMMQRLAAEEPRIRLFHKEKSEGAGPARNSGMDAATGEYLAFIDADDRCDPAMFEVLLEAIGKDCDAAVCGYRSFVESVGQTDECCPAAQLLEGEAVRGFFAENFPEGIAGYLWNKLYRASVIKENALRFPAMRRLQDGMFNIDFFGVAQRVHVIDAPLYNYRINPQTDMFRKCPPDYFDLIRRFTCAFLDAKAQWGDYSDEKIFRFLLNETGTCVENCFGPNWGMDRDARQYYLETLDNDAWLLVARRSGVNVGRYRRFLLSNLRRPRLLGAAVFLKTRLKTYCKKLFYVLKGGRPR